MRNVHWSVTTCPGLLSKKCLNMIENASCVSQALKNAETETNKKDVSAKHIHKAQINIPVFLSGESIRTKN